MFTKISNPLHRFAQNLKSYRADFKTETTKNSNTNRKIVLYAALVSCMLMLSGSVYHLLRNRPIKKERLTENATPQNVLKNEKITTVPTVSDAIVDQKKIVEVNTDQKQESVEKTDPFIFHNEMKLDSGKGRIRGFIKDQNNKGIVSADIMLLNGKHWLAATRSSESGEFIFDNIKPGCFRLQIIRWGYYDTVHPDFEIVANKVTIIEDQHLEKVEQEANGNRVIQTSTTISGTSTTTSQKKSLTGNRSTQSASLSIGGNDLSGRGSRSYGVTCYIDGVRVTSRSTSTRLSNTQTSTSISSHQLTKSKRFKRGLKNRIRRLFRCRRPKKVHCAPVYNANNYAYPYYNNESYAPLVENEYFNPFNDPLSTFSIDVDNASYTNTRRMIQTSQLPPKDAVRIEEFINYFDYDYPQPKGEDPFSINLETATCPWNKETKLVHIGLHGKEMEQKKLPANNLVFLVDVSGSMQEENKLPLVKQSLKLLVDKLGPDDRIAMVTYAGAAGLVLKSTYCTAKNMIKEAIDNLNAGGSTAGGEGIKLAYQVAKENYNKEGNNRIILVTDGDFNVGVSSDGEMKMLIEEKRKDGIFLTVCGFGMGNYKDSKMETIADYGNGNYYYIDNFKEGTKVFSTGLTGTLYTIAKDVKIQVEFNPKFVKAYRLIGYENRLLEAQDFANDAKDAGELGLGHTVTALYEIIPAGSTATVPGFIELKYQASKSDLKDFGDEMLTIKLRYKRPNEEVSNLLTETLKANSKTYQEASDNFRYACGVAVYGMMLRDSKFKANASYDLAKHLLEGTKLNLENGYSAELIGLIDKVKMLSVPK